MSLEESESDCVEEQPQPLETQIENLILDDSFCSDQSEFENPTPATKPISSIQKIDLTDLPAGVKDTPFMSKFQSIPFN